ncbi:MAG: protein-glutamate O-methyltransferase CheR [Dehalococcoidia bacterium]|nr:protein-glutamate O-methyltransferase CheR [Dehalococcoidia bacterium]
MDDVEYGYLKKKVLDLIDIDLDSYKEKQMRRRLAGFLERSGAPNPAAYVSRVEQDQRMLDELRDFLTINVSSFFRDETQFEKLQTTILPELLGHSHRLNIWSAGCSNGSEPYTMAMILGELAAKQEHRILATDIDKTIIARAQGGGPYTAADVKTVPPNLRDRYFKESAGAYWVVDSIKKKVEFRQHNLLADPYENGFDLILCRNVMIYFTDGAKDKIITRFSNSLKDQGVLFLGGSEIVFRPAEMGLKTLSPSLYRKTMISGSTGGQSFWGQKTFKE